MQEEYFKLYHDNSSYQDIQKTINDAKNYRRVSLISFLNSEKTQFLGQTLVDLVKSKELDIEIISWLNIGRRGMIELSKGVQTLNSLTHFTLQIAQGNNIEAEGMQGLGKAIQSLVNLTNLTIRFKSGNDIDTKAAISLGDSIKQLDKLEYLEISIKFNYIGSVGASSIAECIKKQKQLKSLHIAVVGYSVNQSGAYDLTNCYSNLLDLMHLHFELGFAYDASESNRIRLDFGQSLKLLSKLESLHLIIQSKDYQQQLSFEQPLYSQKSLKTFVFNLQLNEDMSNDEKRQLLKVGKERHNQIQYFEFVLHNDDKIDKVVRKRCMHKMVRLVSYKAKND